MLVNKETNLIKLGSSIATNDELNTNNRLYFKKLTRLLITCPKCITSMAAHIAICAEIINDALRTFNHLLQTSNIVDESFFIEVTFSSPFMKATAFVQFSFVGTVGSNLWMAGAKRH